MRFDLAARLLKLGALIGAAWFCAGISIPAPADGDESDSLEVRQEHLKNLSAEEKEELQRKKERFDALPPDEQERCRRLHEEISKRPDAEQIREVMQRYNQWLKTLTSSQRAELQSMPPERRLAQIKRLIDEQERVLLERMVKGQELPPADLEVLLDWLAEFIQAHEDEIRAALPSDSYFSRRRPPGESGDSPPGENIDPRRKYYFLYWRHMWHAFQPKAPGEQKNDIILPSDEDIAALQERLTDNTRNLLQDAKPDERRKIIQGWIRAAMLSKMRRPPSVDELHSFMARYVSPKKREELESLPPQRMLEELRGLYYEHMKNSREYWKSRQGMGPPPPTGSGPRSRRGEFRGPRGGRTGAPFPGPGPREPSSDPPPQQN